MTPFAKPPGVRNDPRTSPQDHGPGHGLPSLTAMAAKGLAALCTGCCIGRGHHLHGRAWRLAVIYKAKIIRAMARDSKSLYLIYRTAGNPPITALRLVIETLRTTR